MSIQKSQPSAISSEPTIEVCNISKAFRVYGDKSHTFKDRVLFRERSRHTMNQVLKNVSFTVGRGEALGLIGHNGCGKSTTLKLLNRIIYPDSGTIRMHGRISSLIELGAGFHPDMSGRENIYINASIFGLKRNEIDQRLHDIIRFSELEEHIDNPVRTYSSGMYMRLAFAIAINVDADILLIDEILAVGDANFQKKCFDKLAEIKQNGATIVIVSHSMDQIKGICDRVIWLDRGEVCEDGKAAVVCEEYLLQMRKASEERAKKEAEERQATVQDDPNTLFPPQTVAGGQTSKYIHRDGNMDVRFREIHLVDNNDEPTQTYEYEQKLRVKYNLDLGSGKNPKIDIIFNIFNHADGRLCTTFGSKISFDEYLEAETVNDSWLEIDQLHLCNGDYILDALIENETGEVCDRLTHLIEFHVNSSTQYGIGISAMKNQWGFEQQILTQGERE